MANSATPSEGVVPLAEALLGAVALLNGDQPGAAEPALQAVLARWPGQPDALHFLGVLRHIQGRSEEGIALIRQAISAVPDQPGPWNNLGNVLVEAGLLDEALHAYRQSVQCAAGQPESTDALSNLGAVHRRRGEWQEAERAYREALDLRPDFGTAWYNLSIALISQGRINEGLVANSRAITLFPRGQQPRGQVIRALLLLGERDQAAHLYREWLAEEPENPVVQHQLAACVGDAVPERASDAYVEQVFDSFAKSFDAKLQSLDYRAPLWVTQALGEALGGAPQRSLDIVDAGCGTGLCGPGLRPWARRLAGCDLSVGMLRQAKPRGLYDVLHKAELTHYLRTQPSAFDVVVSADTLCYFGDLREAMDAAATALRPGGWCIFTVEALPDADKEVFRLLTHGRYAHASAHIAEALASAGLQRAACKPVTLRQEAGRPVDGWVVSALKIGEK